MSEAEVDDSLVRSSGSAICGRNALSRSGASIPQFHTVLPLFKQSSSSSLSSFICIWICIFICSCICICICICIFAFAFAFVFAFAFAFVVVVVVVFVFVLAFSSVYGTPTADQRVFRLTHLLISFCHIVFGFVFVFLFVLLLFE